MESISDSPLPGQQRRIPDRNLIFPVAAGIYGEVWLARNAVGILRAVKIVRRDRFERAEDFERAFTSPQNLELITCSHDGLVHILSLGPLSAGTVFFNVTELADAGPATTGRSSGVSPRAHGTRSTYFG